MKKIVTILTLTLFAVYPLIADKQANNWFFGKNAGITFNTADGSPEALNGGQLISDEGTACVSDTAGNLLFYTDGESVWNNQHQLMPNGNGLAGSSGSTQSAVILPVPGNLKKYYIFTTDSHENNLIGGLCYSIVDLEVDNNLGDVVSKNVKIHNRVIEKLTAVKHANRFDIWLVAHEANNNKFLSVLISDQGIVEAVETEIGTVYNEDDLNGTIGYLKASRDGTKLVTTQYNNMIEIFNFNRSTGVLSNLISISDDQAGFYAAEFSESGDRLYIANNEYSTVTQFDLSSYDKTAIINSEREIFKYEKYYYSIGALQSGPDNKIYVAIKNSEYLAVINSPEQLGSQCDFVEKAVWLGGDTCKLGLPNFVPDNYEMSPVLTVSSNSPIYEGMTLELKASSMKDGLYQWAGPAGFTSNEQNPIRSDVTPDMSGTYTLTAVNEFGRVIQKYIDVLVVSPEIRIPDSLNFGQLCGLKSLSYEFFIVNNGIEDYTVSGMNIQPSSYFQITEPMVSPLIIPQADSVRCVIEFAPDALTEYAAECAFVISSPTSCQRTMYLSGSAAMRTSIYLGDQKAEVGTDSLAIPINISLECGSSLGESISYTAEIAFEQSCFLPVSVSSGSITENRFENGNRVIVIESTVAVDKDSSSINILYGTVLLPVENTNEIIVRSFQWHNDNAINETMTSGTLTAESCAIDLTKVIFVPQPELKIAPNPCGDITEISFRSAREGNFELSVYNNLGQKVSSKNWAGQTGTYKYSVRTDMSSFSAGIYNVIISSPSGIIRGQLRKID